MPGIFADSTCANLRPSVGLPLAQFLSLASCPRQAPRPAGDWRLRVAETSYRSDPIRASQDLAPSGFELHPSHHETTQTCGEIPDIVHMKIKYGVVSITNLNGEDMSFSQQRILKQAKFAQNLRRLQYDEAQSLQMHEHVGFPTTDQSVGALNPVWRFSLRKFYKKRAVLSRAVIWLLARQSPCFSEERGTVSVFYQPKMISPSITGKRQWLEEREGPPHPFCETRELQPCISDKGRA
ncbi:hypothetical protein CEXT_285661 [Caerostris extrusa]|uniref:Uncharacterized protein n=1 Tax=Caerostris extrusa TaxID=172846 RepID=A0AAV4XEU2_CAEEX|nr:hypothetical protein CEXT_285661 [Caerostris extrusa]